MPDGDKPSACLSVLYDGGCPLCRREIGWYRGKAAAEAIDWIDVSDPAATALPAGIAREAALKRFHVVKPDGSVASGAAAFLRVWQAFPGLRRAAGLLSRPVPLALLERGYRLFLPLRPALARLLARKPHSASRAMKGDRS
jgi:predicted DCC family thiol-disulfide oxidoreductase YuxK